MRLSQKYNCKIANYSKFAINSLLFSLKPCVSRDADHKKFLELMICLHDNIHYFRNFLHFFHFWNFSYSDIENNLKSNGENYFFSCSHFLIEIPKPVQILKKNQEIFGKFQGIVKIFKILIEFFDNFKNYFHPSENIFLIS